MAKEGSIPACIVVGFPQNKYANSDSTNLESNMDRVAKFIDQELFSYLKSKYNFSKSIIWGQGSQSGLMTTYLMLKYPDLFNGYISDVPDLSLMHDIAYSEQAFLKIKNKNISYYLFGHSTANILNNTFLENLKTNAPEGLNWNYNISEEQNSTIHYLNNYMHSLELFLNR